MLRANNANQKPTIKSISLSKTRAELMAKEDDVPKQPVPKTLGYVSKYATTKPNKWLHDAIRRGK